MYKTLRHVLHRQKVIWEHLDPSVNIISLDIYSNIVFIVIFYVAIDLEKLRIVCIHPTRFRDKEWRNPDLPIGDCTYIFFIFF